MIARPRRTLTAMGVSFALLITNAPASSGANDESVVRLDINKHTVVTGVVTKDGKPVPHADVMLIAWPNDDVLDALADGERVDRHIVGRELANDAGQFAVPLEPQRVGPDHSRPDGGVQLELVVADADVEVFWEFTATGSNHESARSGQSWGNERIDQDELAERIGRHVGPAHFTIDIGERPSVREYGNEPEKWVSDDGKQLTRAAAEQHAHAPRGERRAAFDQSADASGDITPLDLCATSNYKNGLTESFIRTVGVVQAKNWVDQSSSSSHTLGIAFQSSSGKWSASGTSTRTTGVSSSDHRGFNHTLRNKVNYRQFYYCGPADPAGSVWWAVSIHSLGSSAVSHASRPSWNKPANCTTYSTGEKKKTQDQTSHSVPG